VEKIQLDALLMNTEGDGPKVKITLIHIDRQRPLVPTPPDVFCCQSMTITIPSAQAALPPGI
jgi:hypothetical protein